MDFWSKILKKSEEYGFLSEAPEHIIQQKLKDLDKAYSDGFNKKQPLKRMPTKHKKTYIILFAFHNHSNLKLLTDKLNFQKLVGLGSIKVVK